MFSNFFLTLRVFRKTIKNQIKPQKTDILFRGEPFVFSGFFLFFKDRLR